MTDDAPQPNPGSRPPAGRVCPQCLNPHTVVADQRYRGVMRFCPMCDYSWVVGQVTHDSTPNHPPHRE